MLENSLCIALFTPLKLLINTPKKKGTQKGFPNIQKYNKYCKNKNQDFTQRIKQNSMVNRVGIL